MVNMTVDNVYVAEKVRSGMNKQGPWELIMLKGEGNDKSFIKIFPDRVPSGVKEGGKFRVQYVNSVSLTHTPPTEKYDKWSDSFCIGAIVEPVEG